MELTTRQKVAQLLEEGVSVRDIAAKLDISTQAVYEHKQRIEEGKPARHTDAKAAS